jgi:hypothetical protein
MEPESTTLVRIPSRQIPLAAKSQVLFGFQSCHFEQEAQHLEPVASCQLREIGCGFGNKGNGLIRAAIQTGFVVR